MVIPFHHYSLQNVAVMLRWCRNITSTFIFSASLSPLIIAMFNLYHLTLAAICLNSTVIVPLCDCNTTVQLLSHFYRHYEIRSLSSYMFTTSLIISLSFLFWWLTTIIGFKPFPEGCTPDGTVIGKNTGVYIGGLPPGHPIRQDTSSGIPKEVSLFFKCLFC